MTQALSGKMTKDWFVYILRCGNGSLYTGITTDVQRRVNEHKKNGRTALALEDGLEGIAEHRDVFVVPGCNLREPDDSLLGERPSKARVAARDGRHPFHPSPPVKKKGHPTGALFSLHVWQGESEPPKPVHPRPSTDTKDFG